MARQSLKFPVLSASAARNLKSLGISAQGVDQISCGDVIGSARDRGFVAWLLSESESVRRCGAASMTNAMILPRVGWEVMVRAQNLLKEEADGMTDLGIRQLSTGSIVTDPDDRLLLVAILEQATRNGPTFALVAARFKN